MNGKGIAVNLLAVYIGYIELNIGQFNVMRPEEVGKEFNVTRERIRQIEAKALRKLRHPNRARMLRGFDSY